MALPTPRICNGHSTSKPIDQQATSSRRDLVTYLKHDKEEMKFFVVETASPLILLNYIKSKFPVYTESLRLRGGEGTNFNVPASCEQTSANGLTIIINIPPIWEDSTEEAAGQIRGSDFITPINAAAGALRSSVSPKGARSLDVESMNAEDPDELHYATMDSTKSNVGPRRTQVADFVFNYPNYKRVKSISQLLDDYNTISKQVGGIEGGKKLGPKEWGAVYDKNKTRVRPAAENVLAIVKDTMNTIKYHSSPTGQFNDFISLTDAACNAGGGFSPFPVSPFAFNVGLRSAPISNVQTPCDCTEAEARGFNLSSVLDKADKYKHQFDNVYSSAKSMAEQGREVYGKVKDLGLRSATITNQSHGEDYCSPCGKQNASQVDFIKEKLDRAEAHDSLIIDQVRQQQQTRRKKVTHMLGNR